MWGSQKYQLSITQTLICLTTSSINWLAKQRLAIHVNLSCPKLTSHNNHQSHVQQRCHPPPHCHAHPHHAHPQHHPIGSPLTPTLLGCHFPPPSWPSNVPSSSSSSPFPVVDSALFHCKMEAIVRESCLVSNSHLLMHLCHMGLFLTSYQLRPAPPPIYSKPSSNCPLSCHH